MPLDAAPCVLWDFDGTLAHRDGLWSQCLANVVNRDRAGAHVAQDFVPYLQSGFPWHAPSRSHEHLTDSDLWWNELYPVICLALQKGGGVSALEAPSLASQVRAEYLAPEAWSVYPDVEPCLASLAARGWKHAVLSNHVPELPELVHALRLAPHFSAIFSSGTTGFEKPNPEAFAIACRAFPKSKRFVMVGDSYTADVVGAEQVGIAAVLVRKSHVLARAFIASLDALPAILEAHNPSIERTA